MVERRSPIVRCCRQALALTLLVGVLVGCADGKDKDPTAAPSRATACREGSLRISDAGWGGVAAGTFAESLEFQSNRRCYLRGRPSVWLLARTGRRLAVASAPPGEHPRPVAVWEKHPTYADLFYEDPTIRPKHCRLRAGAMSIGIPGFKRRVEVKFRLSSMRFCAGTIVVSGFGGSGPIVG